MLEKFLEYYTIYRMLFTVCFVVNIVLLSTTAAGYTPYFKVKISKISQIF